MAVRTDSDAVQAILRNGTEGGDYDDIHSPSLAPFIASASAVVDRLDTTATSRGYILSSAELEIIERWLAAHMYSMSDKPYTNRSTSNSAGTFSGQTQMGFFATLYGQTAMSLDPSGVLQGMSPNPNKSKTVQAAWLGKNPSDQINYEDRR